MPLSADWAAISTSSASPTDVVIESSAMISQRPNSVLDAARALSQVWLHVARHVQREDLIGFPVQPLVEVGENVNGRRGERSTRCRMG